MNPIILGVSDTIESDIGDYSKLSNEEKYFSLLQKSVQDLFQFLGSSQERLTPFITDYVTIEASALGREGYGQSARDANDLGFTGIQCHTVDLGGASVGGAIGEAKRIAYANPNAVVLVAGADIPKSAFKQISDLKRLTKTVSHPEWELPYGATLIGMYAILANKLMHDFNIPQDDFHGITKHFRNQAINNPRAFYYQKDWNEKQSLKYLAKPYSTPMIAIVTDHGFATLIVGSDIYEDLIQEKIIQPPKHKLHLTAGKHAVHSEYFSLKGGLDSPSKLAGELAFCESGFSREDVDYAWIYDCFIGMIVSQTHGYFGTNPKDISKSLQNGKIPIGNREIPVNLGGGILNYQAAMSMSGATGLVDILSQYNLSKNPIPNILPQPPRVSLMGNNGGIDSINSVIIFSLNPNKGKDSKSQKPCLYLNDRLKIEKDFSSKEILGRLVGYSLISFNPGGEKKPPYTIALVALDSGNFLMTNLLYKDGSDFTDTEKLEINKTEVVLKKDIDIWVGYPRLS